MTDFVYKKNVYCQILIEMSKKDEKAGGFPWSTAPIDPRFPNQNITRYCFQMFVDYNRCTRLFNEGHEPCNYFKKVYTSLCPHEWVTKWQEQIQNGSFPLDLPEPEGKKK